MLPKASRFQPQNNVFSFFVFGFLFSVFHFLLFCFCLFLFYTFLSVFHFLVFSDSWFLTVLMLSFENRISMFTILFCSQLCNSQWIVCLTSEYFCLIRPCQSLLMMASKFVCFIASKFIFEFVFELNNSDSCMHLSIRWADNKLRFGTGNFENSNLITRIVINFLFGCAIKQPQ